MAAPPPPETKTIRISQVAGRYLLFDLADVMHLRRAHGMCSVLVGTNAQAPNQNIFSGLPLELLPEEAALLVQRGDAYIADDPRAHLEALSRPGDAEHERRRALYIEAHRSLRTDARASIEEETAARSRAARLAREARALGASRSKKKGAKDRADKASAAAESASVDTDPRAAAEPPAVASSDPSLFECPRLSSPVPAPGSSAVTGSAPPRAKPGTSAGQIYLTPSTSGGLLADDTSTALVPATATSPPSPQACPLYNFLNNRGYFMTPGLRFGGRYSVYPGDPFRFHAHFTATSYDWDEEIEVLDLVGTGRLAGAVKKGLLLGAEQPGEGEGEPDGRNVRAFCVEWAGI